MLAVLARRTVVVSRDPSAAGVRGAPRRLAEPANDRVVRNRRRVCSIGIGCLQLVWRSRLQLAFDLVQKAPVRAIGNDLLRGALDRAEIVQP
jgi:hypothetical protein